MKALSCSGRYCASNDNALMLGLFDLESQGQSWSFDPTAPDDHGTIVEALSLFFDKLSVKTLVDLPPRPRAVVGATPSDGFSATAQYTL